MKRLSTRIFLSLFATLVVSCSLVSTLVFICLKFNIPTSELAFLIIILLLILALLCFSFAKYTTKIMVKPLNELNFKEENNIQTYKELEPFIKNLNNESEQIRKQIQRIKREHKIQDKVRQEFTANVSHELKTPLTSISGYAEIIKNGMVKQEDIIRFSEKIYSEAQRLISLVGDIIKLSRLDENAVEEQKERIELLSLCQAIISRLDSAAAKRGVTFELIGAKTVILGIPRIIDEMIYNLCDNAIKYNRENGKVKVSVMQTTTEAVLSVEDTGIGIPKNDVKRVFERFYRVDKSHSREIGGTGLGLSIVKHGAAVHNAELNVESVENQGTTFSIRFKL